MTVVQQCRVAVVEGARTAFVKAGTGWPEATAVDLGAAVVRKLVERTGINSQEIDQVVFGQVLPSPLSTLIGREVVLRSGLPKTIEAHSVSRACATSIQALVSAGDAIALGRAQVAIAGGAECLSDIPLFASRGLARVLIGASKKRSPWQKLRHFCSLKFRDLAPEFPALREPSTGLTMGESAEKMARENGIGRPEQDRFAWQSHQRAAAAREAGKFLDEIVDVGEPLQPAGRLLADNLIRQDTSLDALAALKPSFDRGQGTITAGNSSPLTDGAAALLLMAEKKAQSLGLKPLGLLRSVAFAGLDPHQQLLMGPAYATPLALKRAGLTLKDMDLVELHEAFAAQVLSNLQAFASRTWAQKHLQMNEAIGEIDPLKLNVNGGALALGHPFAASGARMVLSVLRELARRNGQFALVTLCAAGGLGAAIVLERA